MARTGGVSGEDPDGSRAAVLAFLEDFWLWKAPVEDDADLFKVLGIEGDDAFGFMETFVDRFGVEASGYRWYFHHGEEGWSLGGLFFRPIHRRFGRIPITLALLTEAARTQRWPVEYPAHRLPRYRWDIFINQIFAGAALLGLIAWGWAAYVNR